MLLLASPLLGLAAALGIVGSASLMLGGVLPWLGSMLSVTECVLSVAEGCAAEGSGDCMGLATEEGEGVAEVCWSGWDAGCDGDSCSVPAVGV